MLLDLVFFLWTKGAFSSSYSSSSTLVGIFAFSLAQKEIRKQSKNTINKPKKEENR